MPSSALSPATSQDTIINGALQVALTQWVEPFVDFLAQTPEVHQLESTIATHDSAVGLSSLPVRQQACWIGAV